MLPVTEMRAADLVDLVRKKGARVQLHPLDEPGGGIVKVWDIPPKEHRLVYGADFALGRIHGDFDAVSVWDASVRPYVQVASAHGRWGEVFDRVLFSLAWFLGFRRSFLIGEANTGIGQLQRLKKTFGWHWQYYNRDLRKASEPVEQKLGRWKVGKRKDDPLLFDFRRALVEGEFELLDIDALRQMEQMQFGTRRKNLSPEEALDAELDVVLAIGGSPDLVIANMLALHGCRQLTHYPEKENRQYAPHTMGAIADHSILDKPQVAGADAGWGARRRGPQKPQGRRGGSKP